MGGAHGREARRGPPLFFPKPFLTALCTCACLTCSTDLKRLGKLGHMDDGARLRMAGLA